MKPHQLRAVLATVMILAAGLVGASELSGTVAAGIRVSDPTAILDELAAEPRIGEEDLFFVSWTVPLDGTADIRSRRCDPCLRRQTVGAGRVHDSGAACREPRRARTRTRSVGGDRNCDRATMFSSRRSGNPTTGAMSATDLGYLIKRAAVVVTGAAVGAGFAAGPLPTDRGAPRVVVCRRGRRLSRCSGARSRGANDIGHGDPGGTRSREAGGGGCRPVVEGVWRLRRARWPIGRRPGRPSPFIEPDRRSRARSAERSKWRRGNSAAGWSTIRTRIRPEAAERGPLSAKISDSGSWPRSRPDDTSSATGFLR